ncbi:hypothetical protein CISG_01011 [Coccidioides immitis RMSCC 3703]|uniref:Uncharacterized protein n=1 Tax=Coccidioides immitis RMSCC 3703 TaxID=454286 RepID=A0A0J8QUW7_COCIT|nr:hypothetical protein CISG_01011 [Coccidioides immitis RMSCC 3703]
MLAITIGLRPKIFEKEVRSWLKNFASWSQYSDKPRNATEIEVPSSATIKVNTANVTNASHARAVKRNSTACAWTPVVWGPDKIYLSTEILSFEALAGEVAIIAMRLRSSMSLPMRSCPSYLVDNRPVITQRQAHGEAKAEEQPRSANPRCARVYSRQKARNALLIPWMDIGIQYPKNISSVIEPVLHVTLQELSGTNRQNDMSNHEPARRC